MRFLRLSTFLCLCAAAMLMPSLASAAEVAYRRVAVEGVDIFYREAGDPRAPTMLLLHGVPSSSRMYDALMRRLGDRYHLVAPDYPGFGNSDAPSPGQYDYTFDRLAETIRKLTDVLGLDRYVLFMQDYGAPVGMRLAEARPAAVAALVFQNGNVYSQGLGPVWAQRRKFWDDRAGHEEEVRAGHLSLEVTRARHVGSDPDAAAYDPDLWTDEVAFLNRPGESEIQIQLIFDYQTNLRSYGRWQAWLRKHRPPTLVLWGRYDQAFLAAGGLAFRDDLPDAEIHLLDAGHFAMDTRFEEVVSATRSFLSRFDAAGR